MTRLPPPPPVPRDECPTVAPPRVDPLDVAEVAHLDEYAGSGDVAHRAFANDCRVERIQRRRRAAARDDRYIAAWVRLEVAAGVDTYPATNDLRSYMSLRGVAFDFDFERGEWTCDAGDCIEALRRIFPQRKPWTGEFTG